MASAARCAALPVGSLASVAGGQWCSLVLHLFGVAPLVVLHVASQVVAVRACVPCLCRCEKNIIITSSTIIMVASTAIQKNCTISLSCEITIFNTINHTAHFKTNVAVELTRRADISASARVECRWARYARAWMEKKMHAREQRFSRTTPGNYRTTAEFIHTRGATTN